MAHGTARGDGSMPVETHPAAHGAHHDVNADKSAAFVGLIGGLVLIGSFLFGMVKWTSHHLDAAEGGGSKVEATK